MTQSFEIIVEPVGRGTAPAVGIAALRLMAADEDAVLLVMPSDHLIGRPDRFNAAVSSAAPVIAAGRLVTFGIVPERAETGYGYIKAGAQMPGQDGFRFVERFVEKPDRGTAETYLADGSYFWNSGIFMFSAAAFVAELERHAPMIVQACREALAGAAFEGGFCRIPVRAFAASPSESIDRAVMEKTDRAAVLPVDMAWSDVGSWSALWEASAKDPSGNAVEGDVLLHGVRNSYVRSAERLVAVIGMENAAVIETGDATLVMDLGAAQDVVHIVDLLRRGDRQESRRHTRAHQPWGSASQVGRGNGFEVTQITVQPGARLPSLVGEQTLHWIIVEGRALVSLGQQRIVLGEQQSVTIPPGETHGLENADDRPLRLIEIRSGAKLRGSAGGGSSGLVPTAADPPEKD